MVEELGIAWLLTNVCTSIHTDDLAFVVSGFEWDDGNREKCRKHGASAAEIEALFQRPLSVLPDPAHSRTEERFIAIGTNEEGRHIFIAFTLRQRKSEMLIRPISARYMRQKEVDHYEEEAAKAKE